MNTSKLLNVILALALVVVCFQLVRARQAKSAAAPPPPQEDIAAPAEPGRS